MTRQECENWNFLHSKMVNEGFHYCFKHYSSFTEIEDAQFHKLRENYLEVASQLEKYIKDKYNEAHWEETYYDENDGEGDYVG